VIFEVERFMVTRAERCSERRRSVSLGNHWDSLRAVGWKIPARIYSIQFHPGSAPAASTVS